MALAVPPPLIYARDNHTGSGNDAQYVRYRLFLVDAASGRTVASTGYSGFSLAYDNRAAQFSGSTSWSLNIYGNYRVDYRLEWFSGDSLSGWTAYRNTAYAYYTAYNPGTVYGGVISSCYAAS